jgi:hypothetical protein
MPSFRDAGRIPLLVITLALAGTVCAQTPASGVPGPTARSTTPQQSQSHSISQQPISQQPIGHLDPSATVEKIQVSGAVTLNGNSTLLGNGSTVTAGQNTLPIHLTRGGQLDLCSTTSVHLSQQNTASDPNSPLMLALDHGAIEAHYKLGKNSDVVLTPDLRILLSGPGKADVSIRVNAQGDTCVDNHGDDAPYLTVSEQIGAGVYRVQPNQRVMFEHGSVRDVVDKETQPCGCPVTPVVSIATAGKESSQPAQPGEAVAAKSSKIGGPSSTPADTAFPLAESEGLVPPPSTPVLPPVPPGVVQSQVTSTLAYAAPKQAVPTGLPNGMATPESAAITAAPEALTHENNGATGGADIAGALAGTPQTKPVRPHRGIFRKIGHFFAVLFNQPPESTSRP